MKMPFSVWLPGNATRPSIWIRVVNVSNVFHLIAEQAADIDLAFVTTVRQIRAAAIRDLHGTEGCVAY